MRYDREKAVQYAMKWALARNPKYKDYELWGGDCTNFTSQCLRAGNIPFDYDKYDELKSWYWYSDIIRTPSFTAAEPFFKYAVGNNKLDAQPSFGLYATEVDYKDVVSGDIVQLLYENDLAYHTMIISEEVKDGNYLVDYLICQHTYDLLNYPLSLKYGKKRYIKILGYYV